MRPDEAKPLLDVGDRPRLGASSIDSRVAGSGQAYSYSDAERMALHVAHSIVGSEIARLQATIKG